MVIQLLKTLYANQGKLQLLKKRKKKRLQVNNQQIVKLQKL